MSGPLDLFPLPVKECAPDPPIVRNNADSENYPKNLELKNQIQTYIFYFEELENKILVATVAKESVDRLDRRILSELQRNAGQPLDTLARKVGSSKTPVWHRIRKLREAGIIGNSFVKVDPDKLGLEACFFVLVRTSEHDSEWQRSFLKALQEHPEVLEAHRLAGDIDYILKVRVANSRAYDAFYQSLIAKVKIFNITALLSMEEIKATNELMIDTD